MKDATVLQLMVSSENPLYSCYTLHLHITVITGGCHCNLIMILLSKKSHTLFLHMFSAIVNNIKQTTWKFDPASQVLGKYHQWNKFWKHNNLLVLEGARDPSNG
jgi:hypothetical protein